MRWMTRRAIYGRPYQRCDVALLRLGYHIDVAAGVEPRLIAA